MNIEILIKNNFIYSSYRNLKETLVWIKNNFSPPSPGYIKRRCLVRHTSRNTIWVETGTYLGQTTKFLAKKSKKIITIEPQLQLFKNAKKKLSRFKNVDVILGTSEDVFPGLLPKLNGEVNFWLDGHYSEGITYLGKRETPIIEELSNIADNLENFSSIIIFVDDVRCFGLEENEMNGYPSIMILVEWAEKNKFSWYIEHDIFVAKKTYKSK